MLSLNQPEWLLPQTKENLVMGNSLAMPTRRGWCIDYPTGKVSPRGMVMKKSYYHTSREMVEQKKKELEKEGFKVSEVMECMF